MGFIVREDLLPTPRAPTLSATAGAIRGIHPAPALTARMVLEPLVRTVLCHVSDQHVHMG
eukprot:12182885-Karenia_brevis.AAC.1